MANNTCLEIYQCNLQHGKAASAALCHDLKESLRTRGTLKAVVALIQEPYCLEGDIKSINIKGGTTVFKKGTQQLPPRACICFSKGIRAHSLTEFNTRDLACILMEYKASDSIKEMVIASAYLPYDARDGPPSQELNKLVQWCEANQLPLVAGIDANAHHTIWGSTDINRRGQALSDYLVTTDLQVLNQGNKPTFVNTQGRQEVLDITLCSASVFNNIHSWRVSSSEIFSDHRLIRCSIKAEVCFTTEVRLVRNTDWTKYVTSLNQNLSNIQHTAQTPQELEDLVNKVQGATMDAFKDSCTARIVKNNKTPWWSGGLNQLRKQSRSLFKKAYRTQDQADWQNYYSKQREFKSTLKKEKRTSWRKFCGEMDKIPEVSRLVKVFSKGKSPEIGSIKLSNGEFVHSKAQILQELLSAHFPGSTTVQENSPWPILTSRPQPSVVNTNQATEIITSGRVRWAIMSLAPYKAAGLDGIIPILLQKGIECLINYIVEIFRASIKLAHIPELWRTARVVFIPKPGKQSYAESKSFRPISLTSFMLKTLEKVIDRVLMEGPLHTRPFHKFQHAYLAGKSTESALHNLVSKIEDALNKKQVTVGIFFDIQGAFDNADFECIERALKTRKVNPALINWVSVLLRQRRASSTIGSTTKTVMVKKGCPQGGCLSPHLWNLVVDSLIIEANRYGYYCQGYSDDGALLITKPSIEEINEEVQGSLEVLENWCDRHDLTVNPAKTEMVVFTRRLKVEGLKKPTLFGQKLQLSDKVKFLGVILDKKMLWNAHVQDKVNKSIVSLWQCRRAMSSTWGLKPKVTMYIYKAIILPRLLYCVIVWWRRTQLITVQARLNRVQRTAAIACTGAFRTTPGAALEIILGLPPLQATAEAAAIAACLRLKHNNQWNRNSWTNSHTAIEDKLIKVSNILTMPSDYIPRTYKYQRDYKVRMPSREDWETTRDFLPANSIHCYTDGSKVTRAGTTSAGCGYVIESIGLTQSFPLGEHATVFQTEVNAILECADKLLKTELQAEATCIMSDSQATLKALDSYVFSSALVLQCKETLDKLAEKTDLHLIWSPGHTGIVGNEAADTAANAGSSQPYQGPEPAFGISEKPCKTAIDKWCKNHISKAWDSSKGCRQAKMFIWKHEKNLYNWIMSGPRKRAREVIGVLTGHCGLQRHLHLIKVVDSPICPGCGQEEETALHFLGSCIKYNDLREEILGCTYLHRSEIEAHSPAIIHRFITESGRFKDN